MIKVYFVRHGETESNLNKELTGILDVDLNENGKRQAEQTASILKNEKFDCIFCSPLKRAIDTANIINKYHKLKINIENSLIERDFKEFTGVPHRDINREVLWNYYECERLYPNVEKIEDMFKRIFGFINDLKVKFNNKKVLVVSHSGVYRAFYSYKNGIPKNGNLLSIRPDNASVTIFEF